LLEEICNYKSSLSFNSSLLFKAHCMTSITGTVGATWS